MYLLLVFQIINALLPSQDMVISEKNLNKYFEAVAIVESNMNRYAKNKHTTASSYFQVVDGTFALMKKRAARMGFNLADYRITDLTYEQQRDIIFLDLYQRKGTDKYIKGILKGNKEVALQTYFKFHHTRPCSATLKRAKRIFKEVYGY